MLLDALRRSRENDTPGSGSPSVDSQHYVESESAVFPAWGKGLLALAILILLSCALWYRYASVNESANPVVPPPLGNDGSVTEARPAVTPVMPPAPTTSDASSEMADPEQQRRIAALYQSAAANPGDEVVKTAAEGGDAQAQQGSVEASRAGGVQASADGASLPEAVGSNPVRSEPVDEPSVQGNRDELTAAEGEAAGEDNLDIAELLRRAQSELGRPVLEPHDAPLLENLSQQQKDGIPTLMYTLHDWVPGGPSRVVLNGQALQVGQQHGGFRVEEILSDSVVLNWRGIRFRLRALNSWVNL